MNELQASILDIMKYIHKFCVENNINYFMVGGTLLGSVRHKGFIPWDDDMDIAMDLDNYHKFISLKDKFDNDTYEMIVPDLTSSYLFIKVVNKNTTFVEAQLDNKDNAIGVFVDVFVYHPICDDREESLKTIKQRTFWFQIRRFLLAPNKADTFKRKLVLLFGKILGLKRVTKKINKIDAKYDSLDTKDMYIADDLTLTVLKPKEILKEIQLMDFEDTKFYGLVEYDKFLTLEFGDYMTPPKRVEDRHTHDHSYLNLNLPYRDYKKE